MNKYYLKVQKFGTIAHILNNIAPIATGFSIFCLLASYIRNSTHLLIFGASITLISIILFAIYAYFNKHAKNYSNAYFDEFANEQAHTNSRHDVTDMYVDVMNRMITF